MLVLVIVLVVTNLLVIAALALVLLRPPGFLRERWAESDAEAAAALDRTPRPPVPHGTTRRLISIEILNPIELAAARGRVAGLAGTIVPGLTRRIVYDQTLRILTRQLLEQKVLADVRLHTLRPDPPAPADVPNPPGTARRTVQDSVETIDLDIVDDRPN